MYLDVVCAHMSYFAGPVTYRSIMLFSEKGSSSWLTSTALPLTEHGFCLYKSAFRDALCLRYGPLLPSNCVCGKQFSVMPFVSHMVVSLQFVTMSFETSLLDYHGVEVKPSLQGNLFRSANVEDGSVLMLLPMVCWNVVKNLILMSRCLILLLPHTV